MKSLLITLLLSMAALQAIAATRPAAHPKTGSRGAIRALLIAAHPDDEYELAGTIYKITKELGGSVDQVIITDGEAGYRYSSLGSRYYGVDLTQEATGRAELPHIREEEARHAARILGIQHQWFLNERDERFTLSTDEALKSWRTERVLRELNKRLEQGHYDIVFVLLATEDTHGGHKAASVLALEAVNDLPPHDRPAVVGADASPSEKESYQTLSGYPITAANTSEPQFHFDRDVHFGFNNSLSYEIVVDWVIAEHKSQGLFQTKCGQDRFENFWVFAISGSPATEQVAILFQAISPQPRTTEKSR